MPLLEDVFKRQGIPTFTYVEPGRYGEIRLSLRAPGRCVIIEGPSGIGKSTVVEKALQSLGRNEDALVLSARKPADIPLIEELVGGGKLGLVIVDDFHRLPEDLKAKIADRMKVIADEGDAAVDKLILVGINKAGVSLVKFAPDIATRIDIFRLESNSDEKIRELIRLGEEQLNISIPSADDIVNRSQGSFQIAQVLCYSLCAKEGVDQTQVGDPRILPTSLDVIVERVWRIWIASSERRAGHLLEVQS